MGFMSFFFASNSFCFGLRLSTEDDIIPPVNSSSAFSRGELMVLRACRFGGLECRWCIGTPGAGRLKSLLGTWNWAIESAGSA